MLIMTGVVLKERPVGEQDKFIDVLTEKNGVIEICVKGARKITGKSGSSTQLFAYSRFCVQQRKDRFYLNSAEPIRIFYDLRNSLSKISLASYFAEVLKCCVEEQTQSKDILRLFLNCLHYLEKDKRSEAMLKSIFELRLMSEIGYMPDVVACRECGAFEPEELYFCVSDGAFFCRECFADDSEKDYIMIKSAVLNAVRHIVLTDFDRLFNFRISENMLESLSLVSESYIISHLERSFSTLQFYNTIIGTGT
ncbi:MAG: DNA repair protein RecO [Ruminococcus sp.]|nr:DNA repair protein RecO [Ruminococcus sp.]